MGTLPAMITNTRRAWYVYGVALAALIAFYTPTLLTIPAGGMTAYMDDVGEIQVALNVWGTIHHTGYPLFALTGNLFVSIARAVGVDPALAPTLHSLWWGVLALSIFYWLSFSLTKRPFAAVAGMILLGLTRSVWVHQVIAEVYSLTFFFVILLFAAAVTPRKSPPARRVLLLALIGGFGVAHHRLVIFLAPGLLFAALPPLFGAYPPKRVVAVLMAALPVGLIGFLPYLYLPARAQVNALWVYGNPRDWQGFWHEFSGAEAAFLLHPPPTTEALLNDALATFQTVSAEMLLPSALLGLLGLILTVWRGEASLRRAAWAALLGIPGYLIFLFVYHRAVMPEAVTMPITFLLTFGVVLLLARLREERIVTVVGIGGALALIAAHGGFVYSLTHDRRGIESITTLRALPDRRATILIPWSPTHTAAAFSIYVTGDNAGMTLLSHTADLSVYEGTIDTPRDTFYRFPRSWWVAGRGAAYLSSAAPGIVAVRRTPQVEYPQSENPQPLPQPIPVTESIQLRGARVCRAGNTAQLALTWWAEQTPPTDYSLFVHVTDGGSPIPLAQTDLTAPVYGWYPTSLWQAGEYVTDHLEVALPSAGRIIKVGLYNQPTPETFVNYAAASFPVAALEGCADALH